MSLLGDIITGVLGNNAADKAADAQVNATKLASQTQLEALNRGLQIGAPNMQAGWNALAMQGSLLGMPNLVPQSAVQQAIGAIQDPAQRMQAYYQQYRPQIEAFYRKNAKTFDRMGRDWNRATEHYYNTEGMKLGHQLPMADGSQMGGTPSTGIGVGTSANDAYDTFLGSGFNRAMTDFTNNDLEQLKGTYAAGGKSLSGSAVGAMGDRLARNRYNAFGDYYNALSGISGNGSQIGQGASSQINSTANNVANNQMQAGNVRAGSYLQQGQNNINMVNSGMNALSTFGQGMGWF